MISKELDQKLKKIRILVMDVDGTLTDNAMYYSSKGEELKRFSTRDGMGINILQKNNIETAIITSESSQIAQARANKLNIKHVVLGNHNKTDAVKKLSKELEIELEDFAYIGDDVNDLMAMKQIGVSACPSDAVDSIIDIVDYHCKKPGGNGAVREFAELILKSQNKSILLTENW